MTSFLFVAGSGSQLLEHTNTLLLIFFVGHPKRVPVLHHFSQNSATDEYHVLTPRRVFNANFKFLSTKKKKYGKMYSCLISRSSLLGNPGYIVEPPDNTICLYSSVRMSMSAA
ncbi:hypothetical protein L798_10535 [Zootermopsis nevadensis]|uniref:Uncharacterized protein n=1 Tax=Zootermopsis nevadensis TaxID=136037 RepID=A0A067R7V5_ZOONE|nr:hypothetical protein L798_10535 [Zootermopsis nevadensis]